MIKIRRNEPCWCGSGKKYKKCHLNRADDVPHPIGRLIDELKRKTNYEECMHPDSCDGSCSKNIINAHTIQKKGPLKEIADESNHVCCFGIDQNGENVILRLGLQKASTFKGFCGKHDKELFSVIEDHHYDGSKKQSFIAGYRAVALEYFKKLSLAKTELAFMRDNFDRGMNMAGQIEFQRRLSAMKQGIIKGVDSLKDTLSIYSDGYSKKSYDNFGSLSIFFRGDLSIAVSGCFAPEFGMDGKLIQFINPAIKFVENIAINTLKTKDGYALIFTWPKDFVKCSEFVDSIFYFGKDTIASMLVELIFGYIENTYFSRAWFEGLDGDSKVIIESLARNPFQYGEAINFSGKKYSNWIISDVIQN